MAALRPTHWKKVSKVLKKLGYKHMRTKGSHMAYAKADQPMHVTVPKNKAIPVGTLSSIIKQIGIDRDTFILLLK